MRVILKENTANYTSLERLINVDFGKNYELPGFLFRQRKLQNDRENDHASFSQINEIIGYQNSADFYKIWLQ